MKDKKRWGKKFVDKRDWKRYNEELVVRGTFLLDLDWVMSWEQELDDMNKGKVGRPYTYPESLIKLQAVWHQWVSLREVEGITRQLARAGNLPKFNDYSDIQRRITTLHIGFQLPKSGSCAVASDGTGMKSTNNGTYRDFMYGNGRKKYVKVQVTADLKERTVLECTVSIEGAGSSEPELAMQHMERLQNSGVAIQGFHGDGAFDSIDLFEYLDKRGIDPAVKIRNTAVVHDDGSLRDKEVLGYKRKGYKRWAKKKRYGLRWPATEGIFSAVKRMFGEETRSKKMCNIFKEIKRKFWIYERMKEYSHIRA